MKNFIDGAISLGGNELHLPAPLGLCYDATDFDLKNDPMFCPPERNALKDFFDTAKGGEWTVSTGWNDQFLEVCAWFGVTCNNETKQPIRLELNNNGLSGKLSDTFGALRSLEYIDISDNDIKGSIPSDLGSFENLKTLRLSYNQFSSTIPSQLLQLQNLELAHFQSNRLTGVISLNAELMLDPSSFISDCGVPTDFEDPLLCDGCTMCCNILGDCHTTEAPLLDIRSLTFVRFLSILLGSVGGILVVFTFIKCKFYNPRWSRSRKADITREKIIREKENAFNSIGKNSVYCFFLTKNYVGWIIALLVISFQFYVFLFFVVAAEKDFSDDKSDFTYSWRCPRNSIDCNYIADQTWSGWVTFGILMLCHLGKEAEVLCWRCLATYASTVYNYAIARSNADLVENAVIVLYLVDVDEQLYMLMEVMCPKFLKGLIGPVPSSSEDKPTPINPFDLSEEDVIQRTSGQYRPRRTPGQNRSQNSLQWSYINDEKEKTPPPNPSNPHIRWSYIEEEKKPLSMELESFNDNENGTQNDNLNRGKDISEIYEKLHKLELGKTSVDYSEDISKIFTKLHEMELLMSDKKSLGETTNGTNNNDALYQAQNDLYAKITAIERQTDDLRLALQVHKSSADLITDSVRYLHEKAIEMEELSQNSRSSGPHIT
ncbi:hypothetical protein ACHAWO_002646 [Cyclotella atomus]|uniref:Leucine-rich repeat-containing N-terminal plant-type domain-containing protein n=1 Tax=Cyclotella atomus TaxID=382360 RepID=A0ABD3Q4N2_9STRA